MTLAFGGSMAVAAPRTGDAPNYLILLADDLGVDLVQAYGEHPDPARTPNIDLLAQQGVLFRNAYSEPICSASRAALLTGRFGVRTGLGSNPTQANGDNRGLSLDELLLPELLRGAGYRSALCGKWHLGDHTQGPAHPIESGFDADLGSLANLAGMQKYTRWRRTVNGVTKPSHKYATTDSVDSAMRAIELYESRDEPWFVIVGFNAPHAPRHAPPAHLHSYNLSGVPDETPVLHTRAMVEAMDSEIGSLLYALGPVKEETLIIFVGDNGSAEEATSAPFVPAHAKPTAFEGGVNIPFIVSGPGVVQAGREVAGLIHLRDIYPTLAELTGIPLAHTIDGTSLVPYLDGSTADDMSGSLMPWVFSESFKPNAGSPSNGISFRWRSLRDTHGFKLMRHSQAFTESFFFDLSLDPFESVNLLDNPLSAAQQQAFDELSALMSRIDHLR